MENNNDFADYIDYKKVFKNREMRLRLIGLLRFIPTKIYIKLVYWIRTGQRLNLSAPIRFCDKQNWLKIHEIHPEYTQLVDKVSVRQYVNTKLGRDMFFPILGVWDKYEDIDFDSLPSEFVLKCNHDSGSAKIVHDKATMNHRELRKFFNNRLKLNPWVLSREYPYKKVQPKVFAETLIKSTDGKDIRDYKFFCFNGKPVILFVATERSTDCKFDFFDMDFNHLDITHMHPQSNEKINKPTKFDEMKEIASQLSIGMPFVRVDLYEVEGKVYFGEFTFFHGGGFWPIYPEKWEMELCRQHRNFRHFQHSNFPDWKRYGFCAF